MRRAAARVRDAAAPRFPTGPLVVALSGGPDSAVAAWVATVLEPLRPLRAVFVDHGWVDSPVLASAAEAVAARLGIPLRTVSVAATETETDARFVRLTALEAAAEGASIITGHHGGDLAETVVANLLRGAGSTGLSGIPSSRGPFARPLLGLSAGEVRAAADELGLPYADDATNRDPRHLRSRIRHEVLPALAGAVPGVHQALARTARNLAADDATLEEQAARLPLVEERGAVRIPVGLLRTQPSAVASRLVRRAIRIAHPPYPGTAADVAKVMAAVAGPAAELGGGLRCEREGPFVTLSDPMVAADVPDPVSLAVPGEAAFGSCAIRVAQTARSSTLPMTRRRLRLDPGLGLVLTVRAAAAGERIAIAAGSKLVRDAMAEAGIPPRLRAGWPVIDVRGKIAAVAGARTAVWARADPSHDRILELITERSQCWTR